ncbi:breast carcinoma-amplified sequence 1 isoform X1 [Podarcis raffonei]|uniref:breast carcinoma-amplified sequence 1 isoform X1 n=1 Tax=Podarcis raffonei TaxID=65483 RepID=UPI002329578D|nr:breast carcinoma-amplified sequence 1 isoform X1 [Podarcis raffonei]
MGNTMSMQREPEDDEPVHITAYSEVSSEPPENLKNGPVTIATIQTVPSANGDAVDARVSVVQDNVAVSSQKTMELSSSSEASGNNLGKEAKAAPPAAKSRFVFAFSRPVPGRTEEKAANASAGSAQLDVSSEAPQANKALSENVDLPAAAATEEASDKNLREESLSEIELTAPGKAEEEDAALSKPKEISFFDRLFKVERGKDKIKAQDQSQGEVKEENPGVIITAEGTAGLQSTPENVLQGKDVIDECNQNTLQPDSAGVNCLAAEDLAQEDVKPENVKTAAAGTDYNNSDSVIMSFFKTLVSPSKADSKGDTEDKGSQTGLGGQLSEKTAADSHVKGTKKKKPDSPRLGHSTFSKLFRHKAKKDAQQAANTKIAEQPVITATVTSEANVAPPQESPAAKQNTRAPDPPAPQPATVTVVVTNETPKEIIITKERSSSTPTPLSKFFRKKTPTDDIEVINTERIEASPQAPAKVESRSQEAAEVKSKGDEKPSKTKDLRKLFKLPVRGDAVVVAPEEVNGQAPDAQTLDFKDRPLTQAENREPVAERSQESSTENQQGNKQEAKDQPDSTEQQTAETDSLQNGGEAAKENTVKRIEKRQSFGGFFKGLSPKRMSDAEVQTDPVSIVPFVKPK